MPDKRRGRPPKPIAPDAPAAAAALGAKLRELRTDRGLTQTELGELAGYTPQHISEVERAKSKATARFVGDCDGALNAEGALRGLLAAALEEASLLASKRSAARAATARGGEPALAAERRAGVAGAETRLGIERPAPTDQVVTAIRRAFMADDVFASDGSGPAIDLGVLYRRVNSGWSAFQSSRYSLLADQFLVTLRQAQRTAHRCEGRERQTAAGCCRCSVS